MTVDVAPLNELEQFFSHLKLNIQVTEPMKQFIRGAQFNDGRMQTSRRSSYR
jgi:hypothetical protein